MHGGPLTSIVVTCCLCSYYLDRKQQQHGQGRADAGAGEAAAPLQASKPLDAQQLLREAEEAAGDASTEMLDVRGLKRLTLALERKVGCITDAVVATLQACH